MHGGAAKQVKAKRAQRVLVAELEAKAAAQAVVVRQEPEELILDALHDTNMVLARIKSDLHSGVVNPILLELCGDWIDRLGRLTKIIVDGDLAEKLHRRIGWMAEDLASQLTALLAAVVEAAPLTSEQKLALWQSRFDGLQAVADGRAPSRMLGDATTRFTDGLMEAAAREQAAADGIVWGGSESADDDSDLGGDLGVPLLFAVDGSVNGHG